MAEQRIYSIFDQEGNLKALIRATTKAQALAHHSRSTLKAAVASQDDLIGGTKAGIEVVQSGTQSDQAEASA